MSAPDHDRPKGALDVALDMVRVRDERIEFLLCENEKLRAQLALVRRGTLPRSADGDQ